MQFALGLYVHELYTLLYPRCVDVEDCSFTRYWLIIIIIITALIWRPSWSSDHSRHTLTHANFFTLTVIFEHRTNIVAD